MSILIKKSGLLSTIQDLGRKNFRQFGVNPNGAMDFRAARLINILLGNAEVEAVLELHFPAPEILFEDETIMALGGADFAAKLDNAAIENWRPIYVKKNQLLSFTKKNFGNRVYLSVKGGFEIKKWLSSYSTNLSAKIGGFGGRSLQAGDRIKLNSKFEIGNSKFAYKISPALLPPYSPHPTVRVVAGAAFENLTAISEQKFLTGNFTISNESNRMGFRLRGEPLHLLDKLELISSAVDFGTIQLLPDGQMIVLMADAQTSGGYPRIAHVASIDLPVLAQLGANDKVNFELISVEIAESLIVQTEIELNYFRVGAADKLGQKRNVKN